MEEWNDGRMEEFGNSTIWQWKNGRVECWKDGRMEEFENSTMRSKENWKMEDWRPDCYRRCALHLAPGSWLFALRSLRSALCALRFALCFNIFYK